MGCSMVCYTCALCLVASRLLVLLTALLERPSCGTQADTLTDSDFNSYLLKERIAFSTILKLSLPPCLPFFVPPSLHSSLLSKILGLEIMKQLKGEMDSSLSLLQWPMRACRGEILKLFLALKDKSSVVPDFTCRHPK